MPRTKANAMKKLTLAHLGVLALALSAPACSTFRMNTPAGFAELDETDDYDYRSTNAEGVVVAVRVNRNRPEANLEFWSRVVDDRLREQGYSPDGEPRAVQNANGLPGTQFRYLREWSGRRYRYWVTVFVKPGGFLRRGRVFVVEAGGDQEIFDRATPAVERAIASFST